MKTDNRSIVRDYIEKVLNTGNVDFIAQFIDPGYTEVYRNKKYPIGIDGAREHIVGVRKTYPDLILSIDRQIAENEWVVTSYTMTGTHVGEWMGIKPTGKRLEVSGVNIDKVIDGRIVEHGGAANMFEGLLDIGAIGLVGEDEE
jgi:predicted ester cyclase